MVHGHPAVIVPPFGAQQKANLAVYFILIFFVFVLLQVSEIKSHVQNHEEHHPWLANYLVVKRICTQPNFHDLYLELVKQLEVIFEGRRELAVRKRIKIVLRGGVF